VVVGNVQSNLNNGTANRLEVVEDTTDVALQGAGPVSVRDVADANRIAFIVGEGTNEVAYVSVIEACDHVSSCGIANGGVITAINVIKERRSANCRVAIGQTEFIKRIITNGSVCNSVNIEEERVVAESVVAESITVIKERAGADSIVVPAQWETVCQFTIKQERVITNGRVWTPISVELERPSANCRVFVGKAGTGRVIKLERLGTHGGVIG